MRPEVLGSLPELPLEQACRTQPAQVENRNGEACKWSYSQRPMIGIAWIGYIECIGISLGPNAQVTCEMEIKLQGVPCFANGR